MDDVEIAITVPERTYELNVSSESHPSGLSPGDHKVNTVPENERRIIEHVTNDYCADGSTRF